MKIISIYFGHLKTDFKILYENSFRVKSLRCLTRRRVYNKRRIIMSSNYSSKTAAIFVSEWIVNFII